MGRSFFLLLTLFIISSASYADDPTATDYSFAECQGSLRPYPVPSESIETPDTLTAVYINHVGRHGSRFPSSPANTFALRSALSKADSLGTITKAGRQLLRLTEYVAIRAENYWGALDSLGAAEQRGIASRMFISYPELFTGKKVTAISSYSPRCAMSMYEFTHQLSRLNNNVEIFTSSGRQNSRLMRPFDISQDFSDYIKGKVWETPYNDYLATQTSQSTLKHLLGEGYPLRQEDTGQLAMAAYGFVAGLSAMGLDTEISDFFTRQQMNALWSCFNLRQYLQRTATTLSTAPAEIASPLVLDLIRTTDEAAEGSNGYSVSLRFGHAETLMPLYSLLRLRGCYYLTNYFDTVGLHFRDFEAVPMAANLQIVLFRSDKGRYYVRFDINERPIPLMPNDDRIYIPWQEARNYMIRCLPLIDQP